MGGRRIFPWRIGERERYHLSRNCDTGYGTVGGQSGKVVQSWRRFAVLAIAGISYLCLRFAVLGGISEFRPTANAFTVL